MSVAELLLNTLEDLIEEDFKKFKWFLTMQVLEGYMPIPRAHLQHADRTDTVSKMIENYKEEGALNATATILKKQRMNELADRLLKAYAEMASAASSTTTSSVVTPPLAPSLLAKEGSVIIAPILNSQNHGTWNINLNKN
ncbi:hypothetical protein CRENBAI_000316 [Crenichthys baileyi]|uniref:Pyrin domain-containing protein n=1 Tax=Crenichthys baileyi TaxID=28760 RepID=A0AAV9SJP7_9TELE